MRENIQKKKTNSVSENHISTNRENNKKSFLEAIKIIENDETRLLKLQRQYRNGEIKEEQLTEEQINSLNSLYDVQIENLRKSNQIRKQRLLEYRKRLLADKKK